MCDYKFKDDKIQGRVEGVIPMKRSANFMDNFTGKPLGFHT